MGKRRNLSVSCATKILKTDRTRLNRQDFCNVEDKNLKTKIINEIPSNKQIDYKSLFARLYHSKNLIVTGYHESCMHSFNEKRDGKQRKIHTT